MAIETYPDPDLGITVHRCSGPLGLRDILDALDAFYRSDLPGFVFWDLSGVTDVRLTSEDIRTIALYPMRHRDAALRKGGKRALYADTDLKFGLARMLDAYKDSESALSAFETRTFSERDDALAWLTG